MSKCLSPVPHDPVFFQQLLIHPAAVLTFSVAIENQRFGQAPAVHISQWLPLRSAFSSCNTFSAKCHALRTRLSLHSQESFYGHMKDELMDKMGSWASFADAKRDIDDWFDYYNRDRYQWRLAKLSPSQFYQFVTTGKYPLSYKPPARGVPRGAAP